MDIEIHATTIDVRLTQEQFEKLIEEALQSKINEQIKDSDPNIYWEIEDCELLEPKHNMESWFMFVPTSKKK